MRSSRRLLLGTFVSLRSGSLPEISSATSHFNPWDYEGREVNMTALRFLAQIKSRLPNLITEQENFLSSEPTNCTFVQLRLRSINRRTERWPSAPDLLSHTATAPKLRQSCPKTNIKNLK